MIIANEDVKQVLTEIPAGHHHLRTTIVLQDGREFTFQEATIANLVRAYIIVKTDPSATKITIDRQKGRREKRRLCRMAAH